jgi:predicted Rossmann fold nucleotide-binding protein DprA/Smf involved in DNA uptake
MNSDPVRAALLHSNRLIRLDVAPHKAREVWMVLDRTDALGLEVGELLGDPARCDDVAGGSSDPGTTVTGDRLRALLDATRAFAFEAERLEEAGIQVISALDDRFPTLLRDRMDRRCPPHVFAAGDLSTTQRPTLSIVGESNTTGAMHLATRSAVAAAVVAGWSVATAGSVSAGDLASTVVDEAVACEASLLVLTAAGINRAAREPDLRKLVQASAVCLLSPFSPDAPESGAATRAQDSMLHAIGTLTLVVSCDDGTGPTWSAAFEAVQREPASVIVVTGQDAPSGNHALAALGAQQLADIDGLAALLS